MHRFVETHRRNAAEFAARVRQIRDDQWDHDTPCIGWSVRDLVSHVTAENLWVPELLKGRTVEEVGDVFDGDVLGSDPIASFSSAASAATDAVAALERAEQTVHLSFGDMPAREYLQQIAADHLVHAWDLSQALLIDDDLDTELVAECAAWFDQVENDYRAAGAIGPRVDLPANADEQSRLLARFGRGGPLTVVDRFNAAFNRHDLDAVVALMTDDCVFDATSPAPDGTRLTGTHEIREVWQRLFSTTPSAHFDIEERFAAADRVVVRWTYRWHDGHVRGVDVHRVRGDRVAEKLSYVKG